MTKTLAKQRNIRKPAGFETKEMEGYFRLPKKAAAIAIVRKLSGTQLRLWLYLMMEDPFADLTATGEKIYHYIPSPVEIALKIGANQETVEKDMRVLKKLGLYDYRATGWEGYNLSASEADAEADRLKQRKKAAETHTGKGGGLNNPQEGLNKHPERLNNPQEGLNKHPERLNNPPKAPEPLPQADSKTPHTIQTYSDFIKTLSESERAKFLAYCEEKAKNLSQEVNDLEAWLAHTNKAGKNRFEVYYNKFKASETAPTTKSDEKTKAEEEETLARRKAADEFLASNRTSGINQQCVPAPQKRVVQPQESAEPREVSNQPEEGSKKPKLASKGFGVDLKLVEQLKANRKKSKKRVTKEVVEDDRINDAAPYD